MIQITKQDTKVELETYKQTRQGLDEMYSDVWKQLKEEKKVRLVSGTQRPEGESVSGPPVSMNLSILYIHAYESFLEIVTDWSVPSIIGAGHLLYSVHWQPQFLFEPGSPAFLSWLPGMNMEHCAPRYQGQNHFRMVGKSKVFRNCSLPADPGLCFPLGDNLASRTLGSCCQVSVLLP